jgi:hypothetical protein
MQLMTLFDAVDGVMLRWALEPTGYIEIQLSRFTRE